MINKKMLKNTMLKACLKRGKSFSNLIPLAKVSLKKCQYFWVVEFASKCSFPNLSNCRGGC
jgi:hypothetical protein